MKLNIHKDNPELTVPPVLQPVGLTVRETSKAVRVSATLNKAFSPVSSSECRAGIAAAVSSVWVDAFKKNNEYKAAWFSNDSERFWVEERKLRCVTYARNLSARFGI